MDDHAEIIIHSKKEEIRVLIDVEDVEKVGRKRWWYSWTNGYIFTDKNKSKYGLHRYILDMEDKSILVDHINRNRLDNRKCNLRLTNPTGNSINRGLQSNNKSGIVGVSWHKQNEKWEVRLKLYGKKLVIGYTTDLEEATKMRLQAELDVYGEEYAPQRHLFNKYNIHIRNENKYELKYINNN